MRTCVRAQVRKRVLVCEGAHVCAYLYYYRRRVCVCVCAQFDQFLPVRSHFDTKRPVNFFHIATGSPMVKRSAPNLAI